MLVFFLTWSKKKKKEKKSAEESLAVWGDGGLIHTQHYHFDGFDAVFGGGGGRALEEKRERERESERWREKASQHSAKAFIGSPIFTTQEGSCFRLWSVTMTTF